MFQFIKGASIRDISDLKEGYRVNDNVLIANVSAEKITALFEAFLNSMRDDELLFMFIEAPCTMDDELKYNNIGPDDDQIIESVSNGIARANDTSNALLRELVRIGKELVDKPQLVRCSARLSTDAYR